MVVAGLYLEDRSVADMAAELGVTESRISQLRTEALGLMRDGGNERLAGADSGELGGTPRGWSTVAGRRTSRPWRARVDRPTASAVAAADALTPAAAPGPGDDGGRRLAAGAAPDRRAHLA